MIVRLMGEGQFRVADDLRDRLNALDEEAAAAVESDDESGLRGALSRMHALVRESGEPLADAELVSSDAIVPPADLTLGESRELFSGEGLIPDLPSRD